MKDKLIALEIQKTLACVDKIKKVKPATPLFEKIKEQLAIEDN